MWLYIIIITLVVVAAAGTIMIGNSQENRAGNPEYDRKTKKNLLILTLLYVASIIIVSVLWYVSL